MVSTQFFAVFHRDGTVDPRRIIVATYDGYGKVKLSIDVPPDRVGPIIKITRIEHVRLVRKYFLYRKRQAILTEAQIKDRQERKAKQSKEYRRILLAQRRQRADAKIGPELREQVIEMLKAGHRGIDIARELGVSTSYVSRRKRDLSQIRRRTGRKLKPKEIEQIDEGVLV